MATYEAGWFRRDGAAFAPLPLAASVWSADQLHGVAVSGLLARALEETLVELGRADLRPVRYHVDLFRPARMTTSTVTATLVRQGPRLVLLDAVFEQGEQRVARASALFLKPTENPPGTVWESVDRPVPPPVELAPPGGDHHVPFFASERPWSNNFREHQNGGRHLTWQTAMPIVLGEPLTPFQAVASVADNANLVTNWSSNGVEFINADISLALARLPEGVQVGLRALDHLAADGVSVGTAELFDRRGLLGTVTVAGIANARRTADFSTSEYDGSVRTAVS